MAAQSALGVVASARQVAAGQADACAELPAAGFLGVSLTGLGLRDDPLDDAGRFVPIALEEVDEGHPRLDEPCHREVAELPSKGEAFSPQRARAPFVAVSAVRRGQVVHRPRRVERVDTPCELQRGFEIGDPALVAGERARRADVVEGMDPDLIEAERVR